VITEGVTPSLHVDYRHTTIKQVCEVGVGALRLDDETNQLGVVAVARGENQRLSAPVWDPPW